MLVFESLDIQGTDWVKYIGSSPAVLNPAVNKLTKQQDMSTTSSDDRSGIFLLVVSVLGCIGAIGGLVMVLCKSSGENRRSPYQRNEKKANIPNTISITLSSSSDGITDFPSSHSEGSLTDHVDHPMEALDEEANWCRSVYLESLALSLPGSFNKLSEVPEETSVRYGCDETSI